jgi:hypothetical protein
LLQRIAFQAIDNSIVLDAAQRVKPKPTLIDIYNFELAHKLSSSCAAVLHCCTACRIKGLYRRYKDPTDTPHQRELLALQLLRELAVHCAAEEAVLYPAVAEAVEQHMSEHAVSAARAVAGCGRSKKMQGLTKCNKAGLQAFVCRECSSTEGVKRSIMAGAPWGMRIAASQWQILQDQLLLQIPAAYTPHCCCCILLAYNLRAD